MLQRGISSYQIFSDDKFVFKLTTTYETLTCYEYSSYGNENEVKSTISYKRVPSGDPKMLKLSKMYHVQMRGHTEYFRRPYYDRRVYYVIYALYTKKGFKEYQGFAGYRLILRTVRSAPPIEDMYFVSEKK